MNYFPSIERRDSGPAHLDKTADPEIGYEAAYLNAVAHFTHLFDACELTELVDEKLCALVKAGDPMAVGKLLIQRFTQRIDHSAQRSAA
jgi:hypothetical protein